MSASDREPLIAFMVDALRESGCSIIHRPPADEAPFALTFETPFGERLGIIAYAFLANTRLTTNRPDDEHRFQLKYGTKDGKLHRLWQDPLGLYTTLLVGINPEQGYFVGADPVLHSPTRLFISIEFKRQNVDEILKTGWHSWERPRRGRGLEPVEVLVGGAPKSFLRYVRFEREAAFEDQGHRQLVAEQMGKLDPESFLTPGAQPFSLDAPRVHSLAREFDLAESEVLDLIGNAPRLKMAVRGWVAEHHLVAVLREFDGVSDCEQLTKEGGPDLVVRYRGSRPIMVECKNVLRHTLADGTPRIDFQRTRASKRDPCSRYYSRKDFDVLAGCLHAVTEKWEYRFAPTSVLDPHVACKGKLSNNVRLDDRWSLDPGDVFSRVLRG